MKLEKISKEHLDKFLAMVDEAETIAIASHVNPDGDNIGSSLGLRRSLEKYGKKVEVIAIDTIDDYLLFLPELFWKSYLGYRVCEAVLRQPDTLLRRRIGSQAVPRERLERVLDIEHMRGIESLEICGRHLVLAVRHERVQIEMFTVLRPGLFLA